MGKTGVMMPGDVYRYAFPRSDLTVTLGALTTTPFAAPAPAVTASGTAALDKTNSRR